MLNLKFKKTDSAEKKYLICAHAYNGFIVAYKKSFLLQGDSIKAVSSHRADRLTYLSKDNNYEYLYPKRFVYQVVAESADPETWEYDRRDSSDDDHTVNDLIEILKKTDDLLTGYLEILLYEFDEYRLMYISKTDQKGHGLFLGERSFLFRAGKMLVLPKKVSFINVAEFFRVEL